MRDDATAVDAFEREPQKAAWTPRAETRGSQFDFVGRWRQLRQSVRAAPLVWALGAVALAQAVLIALWLWPAPSSASSPGAAAAGSGGSVVITSQPSDAAVLIDDVARGLTPLTVALEPGAHTITVGLDGALQTRSVTVDAGREAAVHFDIGPAAAVPAAGDAGTSPAAGAAPATATGTLNVETDPAGAQVLVDNRPRGASPVTVAELEPGTHVVTVREGGRSVTRRVAVEANGVATVVVALGARSEFESGSLAVASPIPLQIRERGSLLGTSEAASLLLSTGRHTLELTNPELNFRVERSVDIQAGRRTAIDVAVPEGVLNINAIPWAEVWLGSRALGETPIANATVPLGRHELVFRHPELGEHRRTVVVSAGEPVRVGVDLRKGQQR